MTNGHQQNKVPVSLSPRRAKKGALVVGIFVAAEVFLMLVLLALATTYEFMTPSADSAAGVVNKLSYQGRLTDTSGNALGGSGTNYCFRFSIYDASSGGNKVWPSGTPATTTLSVVNGVFNADIGSADTLDYDFYPTSSVYLNIDVYTVTSTCTGGSWESLTPRQQILATGYTIAAENVYGDLLRTDVSNRRVQIGTGAGAATTSIQYLALDVANVAETIGSSCSPNGTIWYNSHASNTEALICEAGTIQNVVNAAATPKAVYSGASSAALSADAYCAPQGYNVCGTTANAMIAMHPVPYAGTIKNFYGWMSAAQGAGDTCTFYVRKGTCATTLSNTAVTCSMVNAVQSCSDTSNTDTVTAGQCIQVFFDEVAGTCSGNVIWGFEIDPS